MVIMLVEKAIILLILLYFGQRIGNNKYSLAVRTCNDLSPRTMMVRITGTFKASSKAVGTTVRNRTVIITCGGVRCRSHFISTRVNAPAVYNARWLARMSIPARLTHHDPISRFLPSMTRVDLRPIPAPSATKPGVSAPARLMRSASI